MRPRSVFAVYIQPEMLDIVRSKMDEQGVSNVTPVRGTVKDPSLPADSIDKALMVDAYHEFSHPREMMLNLRNALVPAGASTSSRTGRRTRASLSSPSTR